MKSILPLLSAALLWQAAAHAQDAAFPVPVPCEVVGQQLEPFVTRDKFTITGAVVVAKYPHGLLLKVGTVAPPTNVEDEGLKDCLVMVPSANLPAPLRKSVGGFMAGASAAANKQRFAAFRAGSTTEEEFSEDVTGGQMVRWVDLTDDPFAPDDHGQAQTWQQYQDGSAKRIAAKKEKEAQVAEGDAAADANPGDAPTVEQVREAIADPGGTVWTWASGGTLTIYKNGDAAHTKWEYPAGKWAKAGANVLFLSYGTKSFTITFDDKGVGKVEGEDGATTKIHLKTAKKPPGAEDDLAEPPVKEVDSSFYDVDDDWEVRPGGFVLPGEVDPAAEQIKKAIADPRDTEWTWGSGGSLKLLANGTATHTSWTSGSGKWTRAADGTLKLTRAKKTFTITFDDQGVGKVVGSDGATTIIEYRAAKVKKPGEADPDVEE